jgi:hypothetical protein
MILNNYFAYLAAQSAIIPPYNGDANAWDTDSVGIVDTSGNQLLFPISIGSNNMALLCSYGILNTRAELSVAVGTGTTAVSKSDYDLDEDATSSFSNVSLSIQTTFEDGAAKTVFVITGNNQTENPITITEVGIIKEISKYAYSGGRTKQYTMFLRQILNEPKTVDPNEGFTIPLVWSEG